MNLQTPKQIIESNPEIKKEWNVGVIGMLYYPLKLVKGMKIGTSTVVDADGILELFNKRHTENKRY
jgi:hypothetical protein